eukprot:GHVU01225792.1.p1 GENE.GHVU01225792.1~~GHVU01225792.1.p1  ORF type:complete len:135 (+),score=24.31 GHVU01225792.1:745-1149(+)
MSESREGGSVGERFLSACEPDAVADDAFNSQTGFEYDMMGERRGDYDETEEEEEEEGESGGRLQPRGARRDADESGMTGNDMSKETNSSRSMISPPSPRSMVGLLACLRVAKATAMRFALEAEKRFKCTERGEG